MLFIDPVCPKPYSLGQVAGCGGTEHTVVRLAEALKADVEQHNRVEARLDTGARYYPTGQAPASKHVTVLRHPYVLPAIRQRFPAAKLHLYLHDIPTADLGKALPILQETKTDIICVSNWHKVQISETLRAAGFTGGFPIRVIYNPIEDWLLPDSTPYDKNKLIWTASPHKGLNYAINIFKNLLSFNKDFKLYISNPGYVPDLGVTSDSICSLGSLPYSEVVSHVRSSLCLFYPNIVFPETFGMIMAEANAVGTPVITHRMGAAPEILDNPYEMVDCRHPKAVIDRVMSWYEDGRPTVRGNNKFRLSTVVRQWQELERKND